MVDDILVHRRSRFNGNGHPDYPYRGPDLYGYGANGHLSVNRDGDGDGSGENRVTQAHYSGRGKGYDRGYGYKNGAGYGFDNIGQPYNRYRLFLPTAVVPARWGKLGLMPQREDGAILVWKPVSTDKYGQAWFGWFDSRYAVGKRFHADSSWVVPGPITAVANYSGGSTQCHYVMAIWAYRLLAHEGNKVEHSVADGIPAAVYSVLGHDLNDYSTCSFAIVESDGTPDPLSLICIETQPYRDGKRTFYPAYRYKTKQAASPK